MVVVDEKAMLPLPTSLPAPKRSRIPSLFPPVRTLVDLPLHPLLHIALRAFPQSRDKSDNKLERQRKALRWPATSRTLAKRAFYIGM